MQTTLTSDNAPEIRIINRTDADKIIQKIKSALRSWKIKNFLFHLLVTVLGTCAILGSVVVSVYLDTESKVLTAEILKIIAIVSTVSLSLISAFNIITKTNNYVAACDIIQVALFKYEAKLINLGTLIAAYAKANKIIGGIDFNFDKNFSGTTGKTVVSVATEEEADVTEKESQPAKELNQKPRSEAGNSSAMTFRHNKTGGSGPGTLPEPAPAAKTDGVKSEAIIRTDDVSVLVSEKK